jgi:hypothetical protein
VHFISALATTDSKFPLQLLDCLTPQVASTLNMMCPSHLNPAISAYKAIHGPYDCNCFPLAYSGCKAIVYKSPETRGSWGSRGIDAWCVGPLLDHYPCNHFFVPKTRAYQISGSAELFPQHCQVLFLMWNKHLQEVLDKLVTTLKELPVCKCAGDQADIQISQHLGPRPQQRRHLHALPTNCSYLLATYKGCLLSPTLNKRVEQRVPST